MTNTRGPDAGKAHREFWLNTNTNGYCETAKHAPLVGAVHVIEFSAYAALASELAAAKAEIELLAENRNTATRMYGEIELERDALKAEVERLERALEFCQEVADDVHRRDAIRLDEILEESTKALKEGET